MRILVADDDPLTLHMVVYRLRQSGYDVQTCTDGEAAWMCLQGEEVPQIAIVDWMMPGINGLELCQRIRARAPHPYVYIILLTGKDNTKDLIVGLEAGADDYLTKPFDLGELEARMRTGKRIVELQNELIAAKETLRVQAMQDPLTQALNHGAILESLHRELARARRDQQPLSLILADLDEFKQVNDLFGHLAGDAVLTEVTQRIRTCLRPYDEIGRYGGDEFLIVLPGSDQETAMKQAERIQDRLREEPIALPAHDFKVSLSLGVTTWLPSSADNARRLVHTADSALYLVKHSGRNGTQFLVFDQPGTTDASSDSMVPQFPQVS